MRLNWIVLFALSFSLSAFAADEVRELTIQICNPQGPYGATNQFLVNGYERFVPLNSIQAIANSNGEVELQDPKTQTTVSLGVPLSSWVQGACTGYELSPTSPTLSVQFSDSKAVALPCWDGQGVFPALALCQDQHIKLEFTQGVSHIQLKCTDKIQITDGSGHKGARVGGDCLKY